SPDASRATASTPRTSRRWFAPSARDTTSAAGQPKRSSSRTRRQTPHVSRAAASKGRCANSARRSAAHYVGSRRSGWGNRCPLRSTTSTALAEQPDRESAAALPQLPLDDGQLPGPQQSACQGSLVMTTGTQYTRDRLA